MLAGSGMRSLISKAVSFYVLPSHLFAYSLSVKKLGVLLVLSPTSHRATQPFAHNSCLISVF